jgi:curved DNA-binding protein
VEYKDYYNTLGVDKAASQADIKKAYRKLVRQYHPDVSKHKDADAKTKELNEAYDVLGDAEKRAAYDELGRAPRGGPGGGFQPPPDWGTQFDFSGADGNDFFNDLFAHVGRRARRRRRRERAAVSACRAKTSTPRSPSTCATPTRAARARSACACRSRTRGGVTMQEKTLSVNIPKGVTPGQQLRLAGRAIRASAAARRRPVSRDPVQSGCALPHRRERMCTRMCR